MQHAYLAGSIPNFEGGQRDMEPFDRISAGETDKKWG